MAIHVGVTAVIPAHNEQGRVGDTVRSVAPYVDEVVVVDDASIDDTAIEAEAAGARVVRLERSTGYIGAIKRGFTEARGDIVVTIDADGEHPADAIPRLVAPIVLGEADMTQGTRPKAPRPSEAALTALASLAGPVGDSGSGLRAMRTELARSLDIDGRCICGTLSLEALGRDALIVDVPIDLVSIDKPRRIAWYHVVQFGYVLRAMWRTPLRGSRTRRPR